MRSFDNHFECHAIWSKVGLLHSSVVIKRFGLVNCQLVWDKMRKFVVHSEKSFGQNQFINNLLVANNANRSKNVPFDLCALSNFIPKND